MPEFNPAASEDALALANEISPEPGNDRRSLWFSVRTVEYIIVGQRYVEGVLVRCVCNPVRVPGASQVPRIAAVWKLASPFDRGKEKTVSATGGLAFALLKEWGKRGQPFLPTTKQIVDR